VGVLDNEAERFFVKGDDISSVEKTGNAGVGERVCV
jgi:hypothetical protein